jgi:hypothetical protein
MKSVKMSLAAIVFLLGGVATSPPADAQTEVLKEEAITAMRRAAKFYREQVARHGGYVYYSSLDLKRRLGEGVATEDQIWAQPPGTPTVGLAYLAAYRATRDEYYLAAARETAHALIHGQLASGGWTNAIDFDPQGERVAQYRNGKGRGRNYSTLDDGITSTALRFLIHADQGCQFQDAAIHEAARLALDALLAAQFPNGGFPQVWLGPSPAQPLVAARYPDYDWRTENRIKEYWNLYTLNDGVVGYVASTLLDGLAIYQDERCRAALIRLGDFLLLAQMPDPQPAWAQQYDFQMRPVWARRFEPPAVAGRESQDAIATLMKIYELSGDEKYLAPIPRALAYLKSSLLPDGRLARYYELRTNRPLYMTRKYELTFDDSDVPPHYGWKSASEIGELEQRFARIRSSRTPGSADAAATPVPPDEVRKVIAQLDDQGRWISEYTGEMIVGQPKFRQGEKYLASAVFSRNLELLAKFVGSMP